MKVCMITSYPPAHDGVGDCSVGLVKSLEKLYKDLDIKIITHRSKKKSTNETFRILTQKKSSRSYLQQIIREILGLGYALPEVIKTREIISEIKPDILHIQHEPGLYNLFFPPIITLVAKSMGIKTITTLHGRDYSLLKSFHRNLFYNIIDKITVHTKTHKNLLPRNIRKKTYVVPQGINKLGKNETYKSKRNFLFFGYLSPHKGLENLLISFKEVLKEFPDAKLLVHGAINPIHKSEKKYKERIKKFIKDLGISKSVKPVFEFTPREMLPKIDSMISVFPYLKSYSAGQSAAILDSIAAGKAVIVTKVPGIFENIENGKNGLVIEPESNTHLIVAMKKLLLNPRLIEKMSHNNLKLARKRTWDEVAKMTLKVYRTFKINSGFSSHQ